MKFAEHLSAHITPEWRKQYIQYEVPAAAGCGRTRKGHRLASPTSTAAFRRRCVPAPGQTLTRGRGEPLRHPRRAGPSGPADLPLPRSPAASGVTDVRRRAGREGTAPPERGRGGGGRAAGGGLGCEGARVAAVPRSPAAPLPLTSRPRLGERPVARFAPLPSGRGSLFSDKPRRRLPSPPGAPCLSPLAPVDKGFGRNLI